MQKIRAVIKAPAFARHVDQTGVLQLLQMKGQGRRRNGELFGKLRRRIAFGSALDEQTEQRQARFLGECGEGGDRSRRFHNFNIIEILM